MTSDDADDDDSEHSEPKPDPETIQNGAFGWARGECKEPDCDCDQYQQESARGGPCQNCGHFPAKHAKLEKQAPEAPLTASSASVGGSSSSSSPSSASAADATVPDLTDSASLSARALAAAASWEIDATELKFVRLLGEGTSAKVFRGTYRNQDVAIKVLKGEADQKVLDEFKKEFDIMRYAMLSISILLFDTATAANHDCDSDPDFISDRGVPAILLSSMQYSTKPACGILLRCLSTPKHVHGSRVLPQGSALRCATD